MKMTILGILATLVLLGLLPFAFIARSRASQSPAAPLHLVLDMDKQSKFKAQRGSTLFADGRAMRPEVEHTLAREDMWIMAETMIEAGGTRTMNLANGKDAAILSDPSTFAAVT